MVISSKVKRVEFRHGESFAPMRISYVDDESADQVDVVIVAGMAAAPPDDLDPTARIDSDKGYGWYVVCNGRTVLAADKTGVSGWGTNRWPQWHRQYAGFIGFVLFSAKNAASLPITTTKRNVDNSSPVFLRAQSRMRDVTRSWISYTNARKRDIPRAKQLEHQTQRVPLNKVCLRDSASFPELSTSDLAPLANVNYAVDKERLKRLAAGFGDVDLSNRDVGLKSFEYAFRDYVEDN